MSSFRATSFPDKSSRESGSVKPSFSASSKILENGKSSAENRLKMYLNEPEKTPLILVISSPEKYKSLMV